MSFLQSEQLAEDIGTIRKMMEATCLSDSTTAQLAQENENLDFVV